MASASSSNLRLQAITSSDSQSEFIQFRASMRLPIAPRWAADGTAGGAAGTGGMEGVKEVLASWVMRYLPPLRAVLLTFDPLPAFAHQTESFPASKDPFTYAKRRNNGNALLSDDESEEEEGPSQNGEKPVKQVQFKVLPMIEGSGFGLANVEFKGMAWRPRVGQKIVGSPTLSTPSHISLLIHNLFNASIPASHIQTNDYHFDPEFPVPEAIQKRQQLSFPSAVVEDDKTEKEEVEEKAEVAEEEEQAELEDRPAEQDFEEDKEEEVDEEAQEEEAYREKGWWRHNVTNEPLGGEEGRIEFTIVGITIANSMISLTGSLLADPFSPAAAAATTSATAPKIKKAAKAAAKAAKASSKKRRRAESESDAGDDSDASGSDSSRSPSPPVLKAPPKVEPGADSEVESEEEQAPKKKQKKDKATKEKGKKRSKKVKQE